MFFSDVQDVWSDALLDCCMFRRVMKRRCCCVCPGIAFLVTFLFWTLLKGLLGTMFHFFLGFLSKSKLLFFNGPC